MMTDGSDREASLEHRAAYLLNMTMVALLPLGGIAFGMWAFITSLPTIKDILDGLSTTQRDALLFAASGPIIALSCLSHLVTMVRRAFKREG